jgi:hypothetical protein
MGQIPLQTSKILSATTYNRATAYIFASAILLWVVTRLVWFAFFIYVTLTLDPSEETGYDAPLTPALRFSAVYLSTLYLLHCYWFYLLVRIATAFSKGKYEDTHN